MKESLGYGSLGNGIIVWDRNRKQYGDYARVAHIAENGLVRYYCQFLSKEARQAINQIALRQYAEYTTKWASMTHWRRTYTAEIDLPYSAFESLLKKHNFFNETKEKQLYLYRRMKCLYSNYEMPEDE